MKRNEFDVAATLIERIDKLESTIFKLQEIIEKQNFHIIASNRQLDRNSKSVKYCDPNESEVVIYLNHDEIATVIFKEGILQYYIDTLNLELNELRESFEKI